MALNASLLRRLRGRRVGVIGDVMLDSFLWGDATRISPEAPVPVVLLEKQTWSLGGAANVAANIAALGGQPVLFGATGHDQAGARIRSLAAAAGISAHALLALRGRPTTVKYRVFARNKHLLRFDREVNIPLSPAHTRRLLAALDAETHLEAIVVSDYSKGAVTTELARGIVHACAARRIPWCVDPKLVSLRYPRVTVLKPNLSEMEALSGLPTRSLPDLRRAAARVLRNQECQHLLVTRGEHGMVLFGQDGSERIFQGHGQPVADVTGAGDTVSAVLGLGMAARLPMPQIAELANRAGACVVSRAGVAVVRPEDLA